MTVDDTTPDPRGDLYEQLAAVQHDIWAHWMRYLLGGFGGAMRSDGAVVLSAGQVAHWRRQIDTPYAELTEREKASDREQVERFWHLVAPVDEPRHEVCCPACGATIRALMADADADHAVEDSAALGLRERIVDDWIAVITRALHEGKWVADGPAVWSPTYGWRPVEELVADLVTALSVAADDGDQVTITLPPPDGHEAAVDIDDQHCTVPTWSVDRLAPGRAIAAWTNGVDIDSDLHEGRQIDGLWRDATAILAAITAHRRMAAGSDTTTETES